MDRSQLSDAPHLLDAPVAFVDVETTGGLARRHRIIEIGIVVARAGRLEYEWSSLVNPGCAIPFAIEQFTGITAEMVRHAPFFEDIVEELAAHLEGRLFVAHNARFDYGFVRREFERAGRRFTSRVACTVKLSRRLFPGEPRHSLDALIERLGLACGRRHRALPDAQVLWQFWCRLREGRDPAEIEAALGAITHLTSLPAHLPPDLAERLPHAPGVYRFFGENDSLLYVGKAAQIRDRVLQHWQGATRDARAQRLAELVRRVDWIETGGELGALLAEAREIREGRPLYNRALRRVRPSLTIVVGDDGGAPRIAPLEEIQLAFEPTDCFGLCASERAARELLTDVAREHRLCLKALGLETSAGSCFAYQLGRCEGACVGREPLARHAARLKLALARLRLPDWPFAGPIALREVSETGVEEIHVLDGWQHLATLTPQQASEGGLECVRRRAPRRFDPDVYRIIRGYLRRSRRPCIVPLATGADQELRTA